MTEKLTDSIAHDAERAAAIREESAQIERQQAERAALRAEHEERQEEARRTVELADIARLGELFGAEARDHLLNYIRAKREEKPVPVVSQVPLTDRMIAEREAEFAAGRAAVAKAEAEQEYLRQLRLAAEVRAREEKPPPSEGGGLGRAALDPSDVVAERSTPSTSTRPLSRTPARAETAAPRDSTSIRLVVWKNR